MYTHYRQCSGKYIDVLLLPCLISALLMPTLATPVTGPVLERVATAVPVEGTTAPAWGWAGIGGCTVVVVHVCAYVYVG